MKLGRKNVVEGLPGLDSVDKANKETGKNTKKYYEDTYDKVSDYQKTNTSEDNNGDEYTKKVNQKEHDDGTDDPIDIQPGLVGMQSYKYDVGDDSQVKKDFDDRLDKLNTVKDADGNEEIDPTYEKLKKAGKKYVDYKYKKPNDYSNSYPVRVNGTDGLKDGINYMDIKKENVFKANGRLVSEEQVLKLARKAPKRLMFENSTFAITDQKGEKYYRILIEDNEPKITHHKEPSLMKESFDKMKSLWSYNSEESSNPNTTLSEGDFKKLLKKSK